MEQVKSDKLIPNDKSSLPLKNSNNAGSVITTLMSTHLVKKPQSDSLFKSERPKNDEDIESIETKLTELKKTNDAFSRENFISNREFNIPEKKITDELIILSKDKLNKEIKQQEYEKEFKTDLEIHKKNMQKDEEKIKKYYQSRRRNNKDINFLFVLHLLLLLKIYFYYIFF